MYWDSFLLHLKLKIKKIQILPGAWYL